MAIFYTLHCFTPDDKSYATDGQRNSRIFLIGMFFYVLLYVALKNLVISGQLNEKIYDTIFVGILVMFLADGFTMAFVYKNYFGRSITNEANEIWADGDKKFDYDEKTHKYIKKEDATIKKEHNIFKKITNEKDCDEKISNSQSSKKLVKIKVLAKNNNNNLETNSKSSYKLDLLDQAYNKEEHKKSSEKIQIKVDKEYQKPTKKTTKKSYNK